MKPSDNHIDREWVEDRIEAYTDGLLSRRERRVFEAMVGQDADLAQEVDLARRLKAALGGLPQPACPPSAYEPVLELARRRYELPQRETPLGWLRALAANRITPVRVAVTAAIAVAAVLALLTVSREPVVPPPGDAEVQAALKEVRLALSYVSLAGREAGEAVRQRAVDQTVILPIRRAIDEAGIGSTVRGRSRSADAHTKRGES